jgi:hypothetical protein
MLRSFWAGFYMNHSSSINIDRDFFARVLDQTTRQAPCVGSTWQQPEIKVAAIHSCLSAWFQAQMAHKQVLVVVSAQQLAWLILGRADHCNIVTRVEGHLWLIGETWFIYNYGTCSSPRVIQAKQSQQDSTETKKKSWCVPTSASNGWTYQRILWPGQLHTKSTRSGSSRDRQTMTVSTCIWLITPCLSKYIYVGMHWLACFYTCLQTYGAEPLWRHKSVHICMCVCVYIRIHMHIHTNIHTHSFSSFSHWRTSTDSLLDYWLLLSRFRTTYSYM